MLKFKYLLIVALFGFFSSNALAATYVEVVNNVGPHGSADVNFSWSSGTNNQYQVPGGTTAGWYQVSTSNLTLSSVDIAVNTSINCGAGGGYIPVSYTLDPSNTSDSYGPGSPPCDFVSHFASLSITTVGSDVYITVTINP